MSRAFLGTSTLKEREEVEEEDIGYAKLRRGKEEDVGHTGFLTMFTIPSIFKGHTAPFKPLIVWLFGALTVANPCRQCPFDVVAIDLQTCIDLGTKMGL